MWRVQEEQNGQVFYTTNPTTGAVYAIFTEWPASPYLALETPQAGTNTTVSMLGVNGAHFASLAARLIYAGTLNYVYKPGGDLIVTLPLVTPRTNPSPYAWALKLVGVH